MSSTSIWLLFVAIGLGTFLLRFIFIYLFGKIDMPDWLGRALRFVPAAALAALVFPALTHPAGHLDLSLHNFRLLAGLGGAEAKHPEPFHIQSEAVDGIRIAAFPHAFLLIVHGRHDHEKHNQNQHDHGKLRHIEWRAAVYVFFFLFGHLDSLDNFD